MGGAELIDAAAAVEPAVEEEVVDGRVSLRHGLDDLGGDHTSQHGTHRVELRDAVSARSTSNNQSEHSNRNNQSEHSTAQTGLN